MSNLIDSTPESQENIWKAIDTSTPEGLRALDKIIAQRIGYTVHVSQPGGRVCAARYNPAGKWEKSYWSDDYRDPEKAAWMNIPHYSSKTDDALEMLPHVPFVMWYLASGLWRVSLDLNFEHIDATPALAICGAFLKWSASKQGGAQ